MMFAGLIVLVVGGLWVLNLFGVILLTGALGLRRRRWGTPGGGWAMVSAGLHALAGVGIVVLTVPGLFLAGPPGEVAQALLVAAIVALLAVWVGSHFALARALHAAWQAADAAETRAEQDSPVGATP